MPQSVRRKEEAKIRDVTGDIWPTVRIAVAVHFSVLLTFDTDDVFTNLLRDELVVQSFDQVVDSVD